MKLGRIAIAFEADGMARSLATGTPSLCPFLFMVKVEYVKTIVHKFKSNRSKPVNS